MSLDDRPTNIAPLRTARVILFVSACVNPNPRIKGLNASEVIYRNLLVHDKGLQYSKDYSKDYSI